MVIVQLTGGLGNQLFQYAMGYALATKHNVPLKLDINFFATYEWHEYSLAPLNLSAPIATTTEIQQLKQRNYSRWQRFKQAIFTTTPIIIEERNLLYDATYLNAGSNCYYVGYWQCEHYFKDLRTALLAEFTVTIPPSHYNAQILESIANTTNAVSLHVRRGNFVSVDRVNAVHGTASLNYYQKAVEYIVEQCNTTPTFYVFSDDVAWAKQNIVLNYTTVFIDANDAKTDYEDLRLMSACNHNILANSTFSWWGAWLNTNPSKIVVAPKQWFADVEKNKEAVHIIPSDWISL